MSGEGELVCRCHASVGEIDRMEWDRLFPGDPEGHTYYTACEAAPPPAFTLGAVTVRRGGRLLAAAPTFRLIYRLDTPLQDRMRGLGDWLHRRLPRLINLPILCLGSPLADRCHLGLDPALTPGERDAVMAALLTGLDAEAARHHARVVAVKDLTGRDGETLGAPFKREGFTRIASLPVAVLELPFADEGAYLASLSSATRKDIRRKLKSSGDLRIETRSSIAGLEAEIASLYEETRRQSGVDYGEFEGLAPSYFPAVSVHLGERAQWMLYWLGDRLIAFNLLLVGDERVIDKFIGMRYPEAREHNLYAVSWMANVRFCLARGIRRLQTGQTAYSSKVRFGSALEPMLVFARHRIGVVNALFKMFGPRFAFDKYDPELKALAARKGEA
ncbi:MAG TPA: GNAT family N-acetyltransferase [Hyphomicrobiaceae bacterium]|nr:GNAT family N-acetyltransferase [Hyphomicrobiaceae bacterium]